MENDENLNKVETKDGDFYLFTRWIEGDQPGFDLSVTDGCSMWNAKVTDDMLQEMALKVEMDLKDYTSQTSNVLTGNTLGKDSFIYQALQCGSTLEFKWKKQLDDGVKFQLGSISLSLCDESKALMQNILNFAIKRVHKYKETIANMKCETEQLAKDRENAILRLEKCIVTKEEMEIDLFQKFVTVLNDKKAKIRRLQETIERQSKEPNIVVNSKAVPGWVEHNSTIDQTRDDDTDVETDDSQNKKPTEGKATTSSNIGSCLFQEEEDTAPAIKRRRKQPSRKPARTPSKPVLPEVKTTVTRTTSNASSTSTNSDESKLSSGSTRRSKRKKALSTFPDDVEDLFGDMA